MSSLTFDRQLAGLMNSGERGVLVGGLKGVEKESLRVTPEGHVAQTPHPRALGSPLTHPEITTDYSEALLELVTGQEQLPVMVQAFLPGVSAGDKRILLVDGELLIF